MLVLALELTLFTWSQAVSSGIYLTHIRVTITINWSSSRVSMV